MVAQNSLPSWDISTLYKKAWQITKQYKTLWPFGLAVGALASTNFRIPNGNNVDHLDTAFTKTRLFENAFANIPPLLMQIGQAIPPSFYFFLGVEILILIILGIGITLVYRAWAQASLLQGVATALEGKVPHMRDTSEAAMKLIKSFIWLAIIPGLVFTIIVSAAILLLSFTIALSQGPLHVFAIVLLVLVAIAIVVGAVLLALTTVWAGREVVEKHVPAQKAFFTALALSKRVWGRMLLLGVVNSIASLIVVGAALILPGIVIAALFFGGVAMFEKAPLPGGILITLGTMASLLFIAGLTMLAGLITTFKTTVWTQAYNTIRKEFHERA